MASSIGLEFTYGIALFAGQRGQHRMGLVWAVQGIPSQVGTSHVFRPGLIKPSELGR